jgi:hypothetical protein
MVLAALGWISPLTGAVFHNLITVGVVSNSTRLLFYKEDLAALAGTVAPTDRPAAEATCRTNSTDELASGQHDDVMRPALSR